MTLRWGGQGGRGRVQERGCPAPSLWARRETAAAVERRVLVHVSRVWPRWRCARHSRGTAKIRKVKRRSLGTRRMMSLRSCASAAEASRRRGGRLRVDERTMVVRWAALREGRPRGEAGSAPGVSSLHAALFPRAADRTGDSRTRWALESYLVLTGCCVGACSRGAVSSRVSAGPGASPPGELIGREGPVDVEAERC